MRIASWSKVAGIFTAAALTLAPIALRAQQSDASGDSLAAAARAARDQKAKKQQPAKVWDNDSIPKQGGVSVVGVEPQAPAATDQAQAAAPAAPGAPATPAAAQQSASQPEIDAAKRQLDTLKSDLDVLQRKYALDQQSFYGKTGYQSDTAGAAALQGEKDDIDAKQQAINDAQKKLDDLMAKAGVAAPVPAPPPSTTPPANN